MPSVNEFVRRENMEGITRLLLNRPMQRNALSLETMEEFRGHIHSISNDPNVRVVIISALGPAFCAGHDLKELRANPTVEFHNRVFACCAEMMLELNAIPQPVIAEVNGIATAAGCQLVAACDLAVATHESKFATPGVNIGLFCSTPMVALTRVVPRKVALEMLLLGEMIDAATAHRIGLVNQIVEAKMLPEATMTVARKIAAKSPYILRTGKRAFYEQADLNLKEAYAHATQVMVKNMQAIDAAEGIDAFIGRRAPRWRGC